MGQHGSACGCAAAMVPPPIRRRPPPAISPSPGAGGPPIRLAGRYRTQRRTRVDFRQLAAPPPAQPSPPRAPVLPCRDLVRIGRSGLSPFPSASDAIDGYFKTGFPSPDPAPCVRALPSAWTRAPLSGLRHAPHRPAAPWTDATTGARDMVHSSAPGCRYIKIRRQGDPLGRDTIPERQGTTGRAGTFSYGHCTAAGTAPAITPAPDRHPQTPTRLLLRIRAPYHLDHCRSDPRGCAAAACSGNLVQRLGC